MLAGFGLLMVIESTDRLINPLSIAFDQALVVALASLVVNGVGAWVMISTPHDQGHGRALVLWSHSRFVTGFAR